jgi:hypothetical protein
MDPSGLVRISALNRSCCRPASSDRYARDVTSFNSSLWREGGVNSKKIAKKASESPIPIAMISRFIALHFDVGNSPNHKNADGHQD